ncbi:hypothetical protein [Xiamenia xianingshaonis]|nr:hypothetical protein [Xiamenia xianingshaonis]
MLEILAGVLAGSRIIFGIIERVWGVLALVLAPFGQFLLPDAPK